MKTSLPYQDLPQAGRALAIDKLLGAGELDVHVRIHADESTLVFCLPPF